MSHSRTPSSAMIAVPSPSHGGGTATPNTAISSPTTPAAGGGRREYHFTRASLVSHDALLNSHGHRGAINQGATCYLNSFLQTLLRTPEMRSLLLQWRFDPATCGKPHHNILLQLQRVCLRLLYSRAGAVATKDLTDSFGWKDKQLWQQHDVQEFIQKLYERMQQDRTAAAQVYALNHGSTLDYITCLTCKTRRLRTVPFLTLPLECKGLLSIEEALSAYIRPERMEGSNAYSCSVCQSKQPADKGVSFTEFPKILTLQLKRFEMDWSSMTRVKITTPMMFKEKMDVKSFLTPKEDASDNATNLSSSAAASTSSSTSPPSTSATFESSQTEYELFSILIHTGSATGGHYYSYTKDLWKQHQWRKEQAKQGKDVDVNATAPDVWFEFNDTCVTHLTEEYVRDQIFADPFAKKEETVTASPDAPAAPPAAPSMSSSSSSVPPPPPPMAIPNAPPAAPSAPPMAPPVAPPAPPAAPSLSVPSAPPAPPSAPGAPGAPTAPSFSAPTRSGAKTSSTFLSDFSVPEAPDLETLLARNPIQSGPAVNAYMLVYRRIGSIQEDDRVMMADVNWKEIVSGDLLEELEEENQAYDEYEAEIKLEDSFVTVNVYYQQTKTNEDGTSIPETKSVTVKIQHALHLEDLISQSLIQLHLDSDSASSSSPPRPLSAYRLRAYDVKSGVRGEYLLDAPSSSSTTLKSLSQHGLLNNTPLFLQEAAADNTTFPPLETRHIKLKCVKFRYGDNGETGLENPNNPIDVEVQADANYEKVQEIVLKALYPESSSLPLSSSSRINLILCPQLKNDASIVELHRTMSSGSQTIEKAMGGNLDQLVYVEMLPELTSSSSTDDSSSPVSLLLHWLQLQAHLISVKYNRFDSLDLTESIEIDDRLTLKELKDRLSSILSTPSHSFKILREYQNIEYKDLTKTIAMLNLKEIGEIFLERGEPMSHGDYIFRVFLYNQSLVPKEGSQEWNDAIKYDECKEPINSPEELAFVWLGDIKLNERMTFNEITQGISDKLGDKAPQPNLMRLRDRLENKLTNIWYTDRTLKLNCPGAYDCYPLVIQSLSQPENITSKDLLITIRNWNPGRIELSGIEEIVVGRMMKISELKEKIAGKMTQEIDKKLREGEQQVASADSSFAASSTPLVTLHASDIDAIVAQPHEFRELSLIPSLNWSQRSNESTLAISAPPWRLRHGDTILYKLKGHERLGGAIDRNDTIARARLLNLQFGSGHSTGTGIGSVRHGGGPELTLLTTAEIEAREVKELEQALAAIEKAEADAQALKETMDRLK